MFDHASRVPRHPTPGHPDQRPDWAALVRELLMSVCTKVSGHFLPPLARSLQKVMAMNLGLEKAPPPTGGMDASTTAGTSTFPGAPSGPKVHPAAAVFGQLMAKALQQQAQRQGPGAATDATGDTTPSASGQATPSTAGESGDAAALLALLGAPNSGSDAATPSPGGDSSDEDPAANAPTLGLPLWMPPLQGMPAVQQITVGPSLQAITGATAPPDAHSLAAFARHQGLDSTAIAWLMNPAVRAGSDLPLPGAGAATAMTLASGGTPGAGTELTTLGTVSLLPGSAAAPATGLANELRAVAPTPAGTGSLALQASALGQGLLTGLASGTAQSAANGAMNGTANGPANIAAHGSANGSANGAANAPVSTLATGMALPSPLHATLNTATPEGLEPLGSAHELSQLRWSQALAAAQANPHNPSGASVNAPATSTAWTLISLDLGSDAGDQAPSDEPADNAGQGGQASAAAPSPLAGDGQGLNKTQALAFQARLAAQPGLASALSQGSDQMQQLSEKMADAIGERMLRELEKGQLNLRLSLKPAHLGHIEVEMRLRAGELDATFAAPQAATRELLQDGLARLRDSLAQAGMDVANLNVKNGQNRQNGGDSTAEQRKSAPKAQLGEATDSPVASVESAPRPRRSDGWDVMV